MSHFSRNTTTSAHPLESFDPRWYARLFDCIGARYDELPFTRGTEQEAGFLCEVLDVSSGSRILDVGCGTARHAVELATRGLTVIGVDLSSRLLEVGLENARRRNVVINLMHEDARSLAFESSFDVAISPCEGAFGLLEDDRENRKVLERMRRALKDGGALALSVHNRLYVEARPEEFPGYDPHTGCSDHAESMTFESGRTVTVRYRDRVYGPDELARTVERAGFRVSGVHGSSPGDFGAHLVDTERPDLLLLAEAR